MKISLHIAIALSTAGLLLSRPALSQQDQQDDADLYETVVTVQATEQDSPSIKKIKRRQMEQQDARSVSDVLESEPAVHVTTGSRGERIFTLRGFDQKQVVVLLDGSPAYIPYDGRVDLNMIPAELIEHVTLIKGPGSVLYGPNGLGGAVNIVTRRPGTGPLIETVLETGRSGSLKLRGYHTHSAGRMAYTIHGGLNRRDAYALSSRFEAQPNENGHLRDNSDLEMVNLGGRVRWELSDDHELETGVTYIDGDRGVPPSTVVNPPRHWRFSVWRGLNVSVGHQGRYAGSLQVDELFYLSLFDNLIDSYDDATLSSQDTQRAFSSWYHDRIVGGRVRCRYRTDGLPWGPTALRLWSGAQLDYHRRVDDPDQHLSPETRALITAAPEAELFFSERLSLLAAFQVDVGIPVEEPADQKMNSQLGLGPLVSLRFDPRQDIILRATVARRSRFPSLREMFSSANGAYKPNPDLRPESAWNLGLESTWRVWSWLNLQAAFFHAEVDDLIDRVPLGADAAAGPYLFQQQNIGSARLAGTEVGLRLRPWRWLQLGMGYVLLYARLTDGRRTAGSSDRLQYRPAHKAAFQLVLAPWRWVELASVLRVVGPQDFMHPEDPDRWGSLGSFARWDARLQVEPWSWGSVWLSLRNILDANYQTEFGFPEPGRELWVGMRLAYEGG